MAVSAGFTAPMLGKKLVSTTYRLSTSCALQLTSRTELAGSVPKRQAAPRGAGDQVTVSPRSIVVLSDPRRN